MAVIIDEVEMEVADGAPAVEHAPRPARPKPPNPSEILALLRREESRTQRLRAD